MNTVKNVARELRSKLRWWDWLIIGINLFLAFASIVAGHYGSAITSLVVAILYGGFIYFLSLSIEQDIEINHLRTALRDTLRASEFTIQKPMAYQITVGWKSPSAVEAAEEAVKDAERATELAQFKLTRARENAANELARMKKLLEDGGDR